MGMSSLSVCSAGGRGEREKGSYGGVSQYSACRGSPGSLPLSQSHGFGAERYLLQNKRNSNEMELHGKAGLSTTEIIFNKEMSK